MEMHSIEEVRRLACEIDAVVFDVDGVLFPTEVTEGFYDAAGNPVRIKTRSYTDGQGVSLLRAIGIRVAFVTNEKDDHARAVAGVVEKWNTLPSSEKTIGDGGWPKVSLYTGMGGDKKVVAAELFLQEFGGSFERCAMMGDDLVDVPLLRRVALRAAPAQAEKVVRDLCHFVAERAGGKGAIRDFANFVLEARGIDPTALPPQ
ncbi:MAG: hypothetical protein HYT49_00465 [Candidatus Wildermuthbacteria bacterium]|nr:hypothetical protein [Candidatus Wildermuthbacteria bacterium]